MIQDFKAALARYDFLVSLLHKMTDETEAALKSDSRWFAVAPKIVRKFLNQAYTLNLLFHPRIIEYEDKTELNIMDLSSMYSVLRMQFETHAAFYHFFMPCSDIGENMVRFRLWELNGLRDKLNFKKDNIENDETIIQQEAAYISKVEDVIKQISYFQSLPEKQQEELLKKALWKFSSFSLTNTDKSKWGNSFERLILNTGIREDIYSKLYGFLSTHTHPHYVGVIQNFLSEVEEDMGCYVAVMYGCFVTAFLIEDFCKRFAEPKNIFEALSKKEQEIFESMIKASRK